MYWLLILAGALTTTPTVNTATDATAFRLIVNQGNETNTIRQTDVARIFLKRKREWSGGQPIRPIDQSASSRVRSDFSREMLDMSLGEVRNHWMKVLLSGRDVPPIVRESDQQVLEFVRTEPGAIGYISRDVEVPAGVKTVAVAQ
jgi:ABC-type phosphate transport system substrate-binding protein